jgi:hypothetical protein
MRHEAQVVINEVESEPLSDYVIDFLKQRKSEAPFLDFKWTMDISDSAFPEIAKDIFAFSNYGVGWLLLGWKEITNSQYSPVGLPDEYNVDQASLQEKFNSYVDEPIELLYREVKDAQGLRFAYIYIPPSHKILTPKKEGKYNKGNKERIVFKVDEVFYRRGTQSIHPSKQEEQIMKKRLEIENYRISLLSGDPDEINEEIYSNLFELKKLPQCVYFGTDKLGDKDSKKAFLKQNNVFPEWVFKFREWNGNIVTFENLQDSGNLYSGLVDSRTIKKESLDSWLKDADKARIIIDLLNRELRHHAISNIHLYYSLDRHKFFYSTDTERREESWQARYGKATRQVAAKMWTAQLNRDIYCHPAFFADFIRLGERIFLRIKPTFILTEDGKRVIAGAEEGTVITRLSYDKYNGNYLNTILFWIYKLGGGASINVNDYIEVDPTPVAAKMAYGILFDIPSSEFKLEIEEEPEELAISIDDNNGV